MQQESTYSGSTPHASDLTEAPWVSTDFEKTWKELASWFDSELDRYLDQALVGVAARLAEAIRYSLMAPGKRLRPLLAIWGAEAVAENVRLAALPAAIAVELIHCYSLIHDDLPAMDDDDLRRGRPTCHIQFDEATAILAGDAMIPMAFEVLVRRSPSPAVAAEACLKLARAAGPLALVGGQADDLLAETQGGDAEMLQSIHARKTGAMIQVSVELGGLLAGATPEQMSALSTYGAKIGQAFQIIDDLLDVESSCEKLGKRAGKDVQRGKLTYPGFFGIEASRQAASECTQQAVQSLDKLGHHAHQLVQLAQFMLERSH